MIDYSGLYNKASGKHNINSKPFLETELSFNIVNDAYIVPPDNNIWTGGIYSFDGEIIPDTSLHSLLETKRNFDTENVQFRNETVIYFGLMYPLWGHCITDEISRVWFFKYCKDYFEEYINCKIVCISYDKPFIDNFKSLLTIIGINSDSIEIISKPTLFKEIIIPDRCFTCINGKYQFTKEYSMLIEEIRDYGRRIKTHNTPTKIYLSYSHYGNRKVLGEDKLEEYFRNKGFKIIAPEKLSFIEQLDIMLGAKEVVSTIGSCSHNSVFAENDCKFILIPRADYLGGYQETLSNLWNQNTKFIDAHLSVLAPIDSPWTGPFCFTISQKLLDLYNDKDTIPYDNKDDFINYLNNGFEITNPHNQKLPDECYIFLSYEEICKKYDKSIYRIKGKLIQGLKKFYHYIKKA